MKKTFFLCMLSLLCACSKQQENIQILTIDPKQTTARELAEVMNMTGIHTLESNDSVFIGEVSDFVKYKDRFYILDKKTKAIHVFDEKGNYVSRIFSYGNGPGEYNQLSCFYIDPLEERIVLVDNSKKMRYAYSLAGNFIKTEEEAFAVKSVDFLADGTRAVVRDRVDSGAKEGYAVNVFSRDGAVSSFLPFSYKSGTLVFEKNHPLVAVGDRFYYNSVMSDTVYEYTAGRFSPHYIMDFSGKGVSDHIEDVSLDTFGEAFYKLLLEHPDDLAYWPQILGEQNGRLLLGYVYGGDMCFCIYDLTNGTASQFLGPYIGSTSLTKLSSGIFCSGEELFFVLDNYKVSQLEASAMDEIRQSLPDLHEVMSTNSLEDNPIIISMEVKDHKNEK